MSHILLFLKTLFLVNPLAGIVPIAILIGGVSFVLTSVAFFRGDVDLEDFNGGDYQDFAMGIAKYILWALVQQIGLVTVFYWIAQLGDHNLAMALAALIFSLGFHFGNRGLMGWTAAMALLYLANWDHSHNVYLLAVAHGILGTVYRITSPESFNEQMRVWKR